MKEVVKTIEKQARETHKDATTCFYDMMDFFIETFLVGNLVRHKFDYGQVFRERMVNPYFPCLMRWLTLTADGIGQHGSYDFFGSLYEQLFQVKSKASGMGQFFTPKSLTDVMADLFADGGRVIADHACGSGRTLLSAWGKSDKTKPMYFEGADLDPASVKMCTLNMMANGMIGRVACSNSLSGEMFYRYEVNEVRCPIPLPFYSLRYLTPTDLSSKKKGE